MSSESQENIKGVFSKSLLARVAVSMHESDWLSLNADDLESVKKTLSKAQLLRASLDLFEVKEISPEITGKVNRYFNAHAGKPMKDSVKQQIAFAVTAFRKAGFQLTLPLGGQRVPCRLSAPWTAKSKQRRFELFKAGGKPTYILSSNCLPNGLQLQN